MSMYVFLTRRELKMAVLLAKFHFFFFFWGGGGGRGVWRYGPRQSCGQQGQYSAILKIKQ